MRWRPLTLGLLAWGWVAICIYGTFDVSAAAGPSASPSPDEFGTDFLDLGTEAPSPKPSPLIPVPLPSVLAIPEPVPHAVDIRWLLGDMAQKARINLVIGEGVRGLTLGPVQDPDPERSLVRSAVAAGFTVRKVGNLLAIRARGISPHRITHAPDKFFPPGATLTMGSDRDLSIRQVLRAISGQLHMPHRLEEHSRRGVAYVAVSGVTPGLFMNLYSEAMGLDWGTAGRCICVASHTRMPHFEVEMRVDQPLIVRKKVVRGSREWFERWK
jgi:hypothetical protein